VPSSLSDEDRQAIADCVGAEAPGAPGAEIRWDEPMARHTTLRIGGPVDAWIAPRSYACLCRLRELLHLRKIPNRAFGSGSNLLVRDGGVRGVALSLRHLGKVRFADAEGGDEPFAVGDNVEAKAAVRRDPSATRDVFVEAGAATGKVLAFATLHELGGVEFLGGVPGTVGGGMIMNAGTYLGEFKDVTMRVFSVDERGATKVRDNAGCGFVYRASAIPPEEVVTHARLRLAPRPRVEIDAEVRALRDRRKAREPHGVSNAGSTFKNPPNDYAGRLIEACGLKGRTVGGAQISPVHANWLVNAGGATAKELLELVEIARAAVVERFGLTLQMEVKVVGED
jgi:UDP-N-acetylmuramate dehydrogenase